MEGEHDLMVITQKTQIIKKKQFKRLIPFYAYELFIFLYICVLHECLTSTNKRSNKRV